MDKIRILMVLISTRTGGAETFALNVVRHIDKEHFHVDFVVTQYNKNDYIYKECVKCGCEFYLLPKFKVTNYYSYINSWREFFSDHKYDIVYGHSTGSASLYLAEAKKHGVKTISHCHSAGFRGNFAQRFTKWIFTRNINSVSDYRFACSDKAAAHLYGRDFDKLPHYYNIPNAIDVDKYKFQTSIRKSIRETLGVSDECFVCGHVGSFSPVKNHKFLIEIFVEVLKVKPDAVLVCCGSGPLLSEIKELVIRKGVSDNVVFTGVITNPYEYMMAMDCFIFPSFFEGFPISALEAQATGLPIVMNDVISKEVDLTPIITRTDLSESPSQWAKLVLSTHCENRNKCNEIISSSKYNIRSSVKDFEKLFEKLVNI